MFKEDKHAYKSQDYETMENEEDIVFYVIIYFFCLIVLF